LPLVEFKKRARLWPSQTASRESTSESMAFAPALNHWRPSARVRVRRLKEENVVHPAQTSIVKNGRQEAGANTRPSDPVSVANSPMMKQPLTLTSRVPQGNVYPEREATSPELAKAGDTPQPAAREHPEVTHIILPRHRRSVGVISPEHFRRFSLARRQTPLPGNRVIRIGTAASQNSLTAQSSTSQGQGL